MNKQETRPAAEATPDETPVNTFATTLAELGKGNSLAELSAKLGKVVQAVRATGKKGKLTYKLTLKPVPGTDGLQVVVFDDVIPEIPEPEKKSTLFFTKDDGTLTRKDPNQGDWITEAEQRVATERAALERAVAATQAARITRDDLEAASGR